MTSKVVKYCIEIYVMLWYTRIDCVVSNTTTYSVGMCVCVCEYMRASISGTEENISWQEVRLEEWVKHM